MNHEDTVSSIAASASALEESIQTAAFEVLRTVGDYEFSEALLGVARDIRTIKRRVEGLASGQTATAPEALLQMPTRAPKRAASLYPRFVVTDDRIVKIGRGKSSTAKPYRHEAPRESFQRLADWLDKTAAAGGREWAAQDAVEALSDEVPSYQTYLMLAALRASGILQPTKRGSYSGPTSEVAASDYWSILRSRFGSNDTEEGH